MKLSMSGHARKRFCQRVRPDLSPADWAAVDAAIREQASDATLVYGSPPWKPKDDVRLHLLCGPELALGVTRATDDPDRLIVRTVLTPHPTWKAAA